MASNIPKGLQNAIFHLVGKAFCLRGGAEQTNLKLSQSQCSVDNCVYHENTSKNRNGSFKQPHVSEKVVPINSCPQAGDWWTVSLLDKCISRLPDLFYVRPLDCVVESPQTHDICSHWKAHSPTKMCQVASIVGPKTNHSLRATVASEMFTVEHL